MPCYKAGSLPNGATASGRTAYQTEAQCLQACREGACCEGTTCTIKPQCQCQGTGKTFKGVGTTCTPNPCTCSPGGCSDFNVVVNELTARISVSGSPSRYAPQWFIIGQASCGVDVAVGAFCETGSIDANWYECSDRALMRNRVWFYVDMSFGCVPPNANINTPTCVGQLRQFLVFDNYDAATGWPTGSACKRGDPVLSTGGNGDFIANCNACEQYVNCVAAGMTVSITPDCNPLP